MNLENNAPEEETFYNSESEAIETYIERYPEDFKEYKETDPYIQATCEETFGKECYDEDFWEDYNKNTAKEKNNQKET